MTQPRRLRGHKAAATSCIASRDRPGLVATSGEDGCVCWFDMRCKDVLSIMEVGDSPISSLCFKSGLEDIIYVSSANEVKVFDVHMAASWKPLESYNYNKEEINQVNIFIIMDYTHSHNECDTFVTMGVWSIDRSKVVCNPKSSFLAAADDGGDVKIIDIRQQCLYKTLRAGHESICSSVQFLPWRPWEVITGGLDSRLVMWDFSKGRPYKVMDFGTPNASSSTNNGQCLNPAFVHAIAVPEVDMLDKLGKICVVARGDGVVDVIDIESELAASRLKSSSKSHKGGQTQSKSKSDTENRNQIEKKRLHLDYFVGGHTAAVSCVAFSMFGEKGKYIISGGNDKSVKAWNWSRYFDADQTGTMEDILHLNINLTRKVNWLCSTPTDSENLLVCDTSKVVKVYTVV